jgi:uncharacterized protein
MKGKTRNNNCLIIDGGGVRGLAAIEVLIEIEEKTGKSCVEIFSWMGGSSTGSLIVALLNLGYSAKDIKDIYMSEIPEIFKKKWYRNGIFFPKYDDSHFNKVLSTYIGATTLWAMKSNVLIPVYDYSDRKLRFFKSYESSWKKGISLTDVLRAACSAQTYFKPSMIKDNYCLDGANIVSNTTLAMMADMSEHHWQFNILSLGTGEFVRDSKVKDNGGGILFWAKRTVDTQMSEQPKYTDYISKRLMPSHGKYMRFNPIFKDVSTDMDDGRVENLNRICKETRSQLLNGSKEIINFVESIF